MERGKRVQHILMEIAQARERVRQQKPLIHEITSPVTMNDCANITLALGASPIMAEEIREVADVIKQAKALLLNMGVLKKERLRAMYCAAEVAIEQHIPIVLDPVGVGSTLWRTTEIRAFLQTIPVSIIKGNSSELYCLLETTHAGTKGVDAQDEMQLEPSFWQEGAAYLHATLGVTGKNDVVADATGTIFLQNGCATLPYVTGTGCMIGALAAAYSSVATPFIATAAAIMSMSIVGEQAVGCGPGSLHATLCDGIYSLDKDSFFQYGQITTPMKV